MFQLPSIENRQELGFIRRHLDIKRFTGSPKFVIDDLTRCRKARARERCLLNQFIVGRNGRFEQRTQTLTCRISDLRRTAAVIPTHPPAGNGREAAAFPVVLIMRRAALRITYAVRLAYGV